MPEPITIATTSIAAANAFASFPAHAQTWTSVYHNILEFKIRVKDVGLELDACKAILVGWIGTWNYRGQNQNGHYRDEVFRFLWGSEAVLSQDDAQDNRHSLEVYRSLWADEYDLICRTWEAVMRGIQKVSDHIDRALNEKKKNPRWRKYLAIHRVGYLRNVTFALFSDSSLGVEVSTLKMHLTTLKETSDRRLVALSGQVTDLKTTGSLAFRLANLDYFGRSLVKEMRVGMSITSAWSLELCHPEIGTDAGPWKELASIQVWFSYALNNTAERDRQRIILQYSLADDPNPPNWETLLVDGSISGLQHESHNPRLLENYPFERQTKSLKDLLEGRFFYDNDNDGEDGWMSVLWAADQAYLALSLVNWSMLLWMSDWTHSWCCSGLRFIQIRANTDQEEQKGLFLPSFNRCVSHRQEGDGLQQPQQQDGTDHNCNHREHKLWNLGLVLAESICATPFRDSPSGGTRYENALTGQQLSENALLGLVEQRSKSQKVRRAVKYCLNSKATPQNTSGGMAGFYNGYVENVFDPIKTWCEDQQKYYAENVKP